MTLRSRFFALTYDRQMAKVEKAGLRSHRQSLLAGAAGRVLEIGAGTGSNLAFYGPAVESLTLTEPEIPMLRRLERKAREQAPTATVLRAPAEDLPFEDDTFDTAVSTLVLCGTDDQPRALRELRRVLRPGGRLLFIEHVRSDQAKLARKQDRMNAINRFMIGCECNRPTLDTIKAEGFEVTQIEHTTIKKIPKWVSPFIVGSATATLRLSSRQAPPVSQERPQPPIHTQQGEHRMSKVSRDSAPEVIDYGPAEDRTDHFHGYTVNFTTIKQDSDLAPLLKGLPDDSCQCPHWGYLTAGRLTVRYADHEEVIEPGDAFYMPPGHVPSAVAGSEFVMFSPQEELEVSEAAMKANMQRMSQGA